MGLSDWFRRPTRGRLLTLPPKGRALILSDLHGHVGDWRAFLAASRALERLEAGEDLYVLLTGDVPDVARHRSVDESVPEDGDVQIVDELIAARAALGERGQRIVYLEGNHDFHVARICREVARFHAFRRGTPAPGPNDAPPLDPADYVEYCEYYRATYGDAVFENNLGPYDMVSRLRPEHVRFLESGPVLALLGAARVAVTHAGPPRMGGWRARSLRQAIDGSSAEELRGAAPDDYYASPYHQLLNSRFRNGDYTLADLRAFLDLFDADLLVTGHTPHPYLVDFERRAPLADCAFHRGLGVIGGQQVVLASSFGAFHAAHKRYLELDLARPAGGLEGLVAADAIRPLYSAEAAASSPMRPLPGAELFADAEQPVP